MNRKFILASAAAALVLGFNLTGKSSSSSPPAGHAGAPGEMTCAMSGCHTGTVNAGGGSVALVNPPANYTPGATYTMQISVTDANKTRFGFELVALRSNNQQAGTIMLVSSTNTALQTQGAKTYLSHRNASATNTWTFTWLAPATNVGPVTFYMAGNAANGNNTTSGDNIYTASKVLTPAATNTGIKEDKAAAVKVFPSPASASLNLDFPEKPQTVKVLDLAGREVFNQTASEAANAIDVSQYPNGTYFLQIEQEKSVLLKRFVVLH
ncbi:T9SS type A sorting domain-containing protein [Adhaeribacter sp. BT258]|uniref:T9SS type A sorting domain-containing protein n=1 Tax=Adhaeribacter terrigena TaxID=2793070 RepID=A0ABS1BYP5_9BACT|nr:choice-of-anchor V domain-containing protein [Adhaeribacter terrigena]MBK0402234.1 T9SS type A sorting domain-containing protein [Adhaeribacter terrigena]